MKGFVYILKSRKNSSFYIGSTRDLEERFLQHQSGRSKYTKNILPLDLVFSQEYSTIQSARKIEYKLKN